MSYIKNHFNSAKILYIYFNISYYLLFKYLNNRFYLYKYIHICIEIQTKMNCFTGLNGRGHKHNNGFSMHWYVLIFSYFYSFVINMFIKFLYNKHIHIREYSVSIACRDCIIGNHSWHQVNMVYVNSFCMSINLWTSLSLESGKWLCMLACIASKGSSSQHVACVCQLSNLIYTVDPYIWHHSLWSIKLCTVI